MLAIANKAVEPVRWLIVIALAYLLATTVLYIITEPAKTVTAASQQLANDNPTPSININTVLSRNLFGDATANPIAVEEINEPVAKTRLPLELQGVFVAEHPEDSAAIIAQKNKGGILYGIGEKVPGNAELVEVQATQVILRRAGVRETLTFPDKTGQFVAQPNEDDGFNGSQASAGSQSQANANTGLINESSLADSSASQLPPPATAREFVERYRDQLTSDPQGALGQLGIEPVAAGSAAGYRLGNLAQSPYLSQTGLQSGDVILSVNGSPIGNLKQDQQRIDNVLTQGSARLEVQRGSRRFFVTASLK